MKKAVKSYEEVVGAKINFNKSKGLWLDAWWGGVRLARPFRWSDGPVCILGVWFGPDFQGTVSGVSGGFNFGSSHVAI